MPNEASQARPIKCWPWRCVKACIKARVLPCYCYETKALICHCMQCQQNTPAEEINKTQMSSSKKSHGVLKWAEVIDKTFLNRLFIVADWNGGWISTTTSISKTFLSLSRPSFSSEKTMKLPPPGTKRKAFYYACLSNRLSTKQVFCLQ